MWCVCHAVNVGSYLGVAHCEEGDMMFCSCLCGTSAEKSKLIVGPSNMLCRVLYGATESSREPEVSRGTY